MAGVGIGLVWVAYTAGLWGYCLFRGYAITPKQLLSQTWPPVINSEKPANTTPNNTTHTA